MSGSAQDSQGSARAEKWRYGWRFSAIRWGLAALVPLAAGMALLLVQG